MSLASSAHTYLLTYLPTCLHTYIHKSNVHVHMCAIINILLSLSSFYTADSGILDHGVAIMSI